MNVKYTGTFACSTSEPMLDWQPDETKDLTKDEADSLSSNVLFVTAPAPTPTTPSLAATPAPVTPAVAEQSGKE